MKLCLCTLSSVTVKGWVAPPLVDYSVCKNRIQSSLLYSRGNQFVWNREHSAPKKRWHVLVSGNSSTGIKHAWKHWKLYWIVSAQSTEAVAPWWKREAKSKAMWETGSRDSLWDPRSSASSHWATPLVSLQHTSSGRHREEKKKPASQIHSIFNYLPFILFFTLYLDSLYTHAAGLLTKPTLPSINFCHDVRHWWKLHTESGEDVCVSPCAGLLLYWCSY